MTPFPYSFDGKPLMVRVALPMVVPFAGCPEGGALATGLGVELALGVGLALPIGLGDGVGAPNPGGTTPRSYTLITAPEPRIC